MKYVVVCRRKDGLGDWFTSEFDSISAAISAAEMDWVHQTNAEKRDRTIYVLESVDPDEDSEFHMDGNIVFDASNA